MSCRRRRAGLLAAVAYGAVASAAAAGPLSIDLRPLRGGGPDSPRTPPFAASTFAAHASIVAASHPETFPTPVAAALGVVAASAALAEQAAQHKQAAPSSPVETRARAVNWVAVAVDAAWLSHALIVHHDHDFNAQFGALGRLSAPPRPTITPTRNHSTSLPTIQVPPPPTAHRPPPNQPPTAHHPVRPRLGRGRLRRPLRWLGRSDGLPQHCSGRVGRPLAGQVCGLPQLRRRRALPRPRLGPVVLGTPRRHRRRPVASPVA